IERTWIAVDLCGNSTSCLQVVEVVDETAPLLACPANLTLECTAGTEPESTGFATATDNCDAMPEIANADDTDAGGCPNEWTIQRTWTATDTCGNSSTCMQTLTIIDATAPAITCPADITITCLEDTSPDSTGVATATDNCDATPGVDFTDNILNPPG